MQTSSVLIDDLPTGWTETELIHLAAEGKYPIGDGDHGQIKPSCYSKKGIPYIRVADLSWGSFKPNGLVFIPKEVHEQNLKSQLFPGDIVIAKTGATIGKCCIISEDMKTANTTSSVGKVSINTNATSSKYILYYFLSREFKDQMWAVSEKTAQPGFNIDDLKKFIIPLPPLPEQNRIVEKLDKILPRIESCKSRLEIIPLTLKRFRQGILASAYRGELTESWRKNNKSSNVNIVFEKIKSKLIEHENKGTIKKITRVNSIGASDNLDEIPDTWLYEKLGNICSHVSDIDHNMPKAVKKGVKFLSAKDLLDDGTLNLTEDIKYISEEDFKRLSRKIKPEYGDIIYSRIGARLGKARIVNTKETFLVSYSCCVIRPIVVNVAYINYFLNTESVLKRALGDSQSIGVPDLGIQKIKEFDVPIPPLEEQAEIVRRVEALFALADNLESQYLKAKTKVDKLTQSILAKAFRGELVPQDPNDEPASVLLDRIKAQNEAISDSTKKFKGKLSKVKA